MVVVPEKRRKEATAGVGHPERQLTDVWDGGKDRRQGKVERKNNKGRWTVLVYVIKKI